jgi:hypothetical protein
MIQDANLTWRYIQTESNLLMPWYTLPCLQWLVKQDVSKWDVFEYGAGYSTIWWRLNAETIWSVETNHQWAQAMGAEFVPSKDEFINKIKDDHIHFDCIIVDGEWREECVEVCRPYLKPGGVLIIDNYDQIIPDYPQPSFPETEKIDALLEGWGKQVFKHPTHTHWKTAVFQKPA